MAIFIIMNTTRHLKTTVEEHLANKTNAIVELFTTIRNEINKFENIDQRVVDPYIGYYLKNGKDDPLFVELHILRSRIVLHLRKVDYKNHGALVVSEKPDSHRWTLNKLVNVSNKSELTYAISLIEQSYRDVS